MEGKPYSKEVDYWSLGCLLFEMMMGRSAFEMKSGKFQDLRKAIMKGRFKFPQQCDLSRQAKDIIKKLICVDVNHRLGSKGISEIKNHPWFASINWQDVLEKRIKSPLKIKVLNPTNLNTSVEESLQQTTNILVKGFTWSDDQCLSYEIENVSK